MSPIAIPRAAAVSSHILVRWSHPRTDKSKSRDPSETKDLRELNLVMGASGHPGR